MKIKSNREEGYIVMGNYHLKDRRLSLKAKGLLSLMLSLPDNWDYSILGLSSICVESRDENGRFDYEYIIYEKPYEN